MDSNESETEVDVKPLIFGYPCLICTEQQREESVNFIEGLPIYQNEQIFNLLSKSFKITWNSKDKKQNWNFHTEPLPFCTSCLKISSDLLEICEQVQRLETEYANKIDALRNLVIATSQEGSTEHKFLSNDKNYHKKFDFFRKQVAGTLQGRKRGRPKKNPPLPEHPELQSHGRKIRAVVEDKEPCQITKSHRVSKRVDNNSADATISRNLEDDPLFLDKNDATEIKLEKNFEAEGRKDTTTQKDAKPFIERIEIEPDFSDLEGDEFENLFPGSSSEESSVGTRNPQAKVSNTKVRSKLRTRKKNPKYMAESESETDEPRQSRDPDFRLDKSEESSLDGNDEGELDESDSDNQRKEKDPLIKWKKTSRGRLFYDGIEVSTIDNGLKCTSCNETVVGGKRENRKNRMKYHIQLKHLNSFKCSLCDKVHTNQSTLDTHIKLIHEKSIIIPCNVCAKPFTTRMAMRRHAWDHQNEEEKAAARAITDGKKKYAKAKSGNAPVLKLAVYQCRHCGKMLHTPRTLKNHEETHLDKSERSTHICQICGSVYYSSLGLKNHTKRKHGDKLNWHQCPHCPMKFPFIQPLKMHMIYHTGEKPYKCLECGTGCISSTMLKIHMNMHKNIRPHKCKDCDMAFFQKYHLRRHRDVYHDSENPPERKQSYRRRDGTRTPYIRKNKKKQQRSEQLSSGTETTRATMDPRPQSEAQYGTGQELAQNNVNNLNHSNSFNPENASSNNNNAFPFMQPISSFNTLENVW